MAQRQSARQADFDTARRKSQVEIVREGWAKLEAEINADAAMTIFLKEILDRGGADICVNAFELVTRVLHPEGCEASAQKRKPKHESVY